MTNLALKLVEGTKEDRDVYIDRVDVLDKVNKITMIPDMKYTTTREVAKYYNVDVGTIRQIRNRHRDEFDSDGVVFLKGEELTNYRNRIQSLHDVTIKANAQLTLFTRRSILRVGMLLVNSEVAQKVRDYLLNSEEITTKEQKQKNLYNGEWTPKIENFVLNLVKNNKEAGVSVLQSLKEASNKTGVSFSQLNARWYGAASYDALKEKLGSLNNERKGEEQNLVEEIQQIFKIQRADYKNLINNINNEFKQQIEMNQTLFKEINSLKLSNNQLHNDVSKLWRKLEQVYEQNEDIKADASNINDLISKINDSVDLRNNYDFQLLRKKNKGLNDKLKSQQNENDKMLKFIGKSSLMTENLVDVESPGQMSFRMDRNGNLNKL